MPALLENPLIGRLWKFLEYISFQYRLASLFKQTVVFNFLKFFKQELAVDLGTANTLIMVDDVVVVDEPSIIAIDRRTGATIATGHRAMQMHEKTHENIKTIRPLKDGVIADFQAAEAMIQSMIKMVGRKNNFFSHLKMVICIPSGITEVEKRAVFESADHVDSKETYLIHEPMAAALGIGLNVEEPIGNMIIDIGGGTTEIAVIALSGIVCDQSIRISGFECTYIHTCAVLDRNINTCSLLCGVGY